MEAVYSSEMFLDLLQAIWCYIPEDNALIGTVVSALVSDEKLPVIALTN
jgi:hypothetical protein